MQTLATSVVQPGPSVWTWRALVVPALAMAYGLVVWRLTGATPGQTAKALLAVYAMGHVAGAAIVDRPDPRAPLVQAGLRLGTGLVLSSFAFLLSLVLSLPWFLGPAAVVIAGACRGRHAFVFPSFHRPERRGDRFAGLLGGILVASIVISALRMAPGPFPPVFYNVDTPYMLEHVHALTKADTYPPASLGNADGRRTYHYGTQASAALMTRVSGIAPHHALFAFVLPLFAVSVVAAAFAAARAIGPVLPAALAVPLLLIEVPSLWYGFADTAGRAVAGAWTTWSFAPLVAFARDYELWGAASIVAPNVASQFILLTSLAGIAAGPALGWRLPVVLIGMAPIIKVPTSAVLVAGLVLAQSWRALATRHVRPLLPAAAAVALFGVTYLVFFVMQATSESFEVELFPLFHLSQVIERHGAAGLIVDIAWTLLPIGLAWTLPRRDASDQRNTMAFLFMALVPIAIVNLTRLMDLRPGRDTPDNDWLQVLLPMPLLLHAWVLSYLNGRWRQLGAGRRAATTGVLVMSLAPPILISVQYAGLLVVNPTAGHEFADNRPLARALAVIPPDGSLIVTNDLRYPAEDFNRDERQMQIPAIAGHQAFAVNPNYERYAFSSQRERLQALLRADTWSPAIDEAASTHGWTHLLIHKPYDHPAAIPLAQIFDSDRYAVYQFPH